MLISGPGYAVFDPIPETGLGIGPALDIEALFRKPESWEGRHLDTTRVEQAIIATLIFCIQNFRQNMTGGNERLVSIIEDLATFVIFLYSENFRSIVSLAADEQNIFPDTIPNSPLVEKFIAEIRKQDKGTTLIPKTLKIMSGRCHMALTNLCRIISSILSPEETDALGAIKKSVDQVCPQHDLS